MSEYVYVVGGKRYVACPIPGSKTVAWTDPKGLTIMKGYTLEHALETRKEWSDA